MQIERWSKILSVTPFHLVQHGVAAVFFVVLPLAANSSNLSDSHQAIDSGDTVVAQVGRHSFTPSPDAPPSNPSYPPGAGPHSPAGVPFWARDRGHDRNSPFAPPPTEDQSGCQQGEGYHKWIKCLEILKVVCNTNHSFIRRDKDAYSELLDTYNELNPYDQEALLWSTEHGYKFAARCVHDKIRRDAEIQMASKYRMLREIEALEAKSRTPNKQ